MTVILESKFCDVSMYFIFIRKTGLLNHTILHARISYCIMDYPEKLPWWCQVIRITINTQGKVFFVCFHSLLKWNHQKRRKIWVGHNLKNILKSKNCKNETRGCNDRRALYQFAWIFPFCSVFTMQRGAGCQVDIAGLQKVAFSVLPIKWLLPKSWQEKLLLTCQ